MARILQVCNTGFYLQRFLAPLLRALVERGHRVDAICESPTPALSELIPGVRVYDVAFPKTGSIHAFYKTIRVVRGVIRETRPDCVNSHTRNASVVARMSAWLEEVPLNVYTAHGAYFHEDQSAVRFELAAAIEVLLGQVTHHTMSQSAEDAERLVRRGAASADRMDVIGNGIDVSRFVPVRDRRAVERALDLPHDRFRIVGVGRLVEGKGFADLIEAFGRLREDLPEAELVLVGGELPTDISPYQAQLEARIEALGVRDHIVLTGLVDNVPEWLQAADVFVLPSYREGLPRGLIEAMAIGLPTIATAIRGCTEATVDTETGFLYPPRNVEALLGLLRRMQALGPRGRAEMGAAGRARALEAFSEVDYVQRQVDVLERLLPTP